MSFSLIRECIIRFDAHSCYVFMGDKAGEIHIFKLGEGQSLKAITTLKGHSGMCFLQLSLSYSDFVNVMQ